MDTSNTQSSEEDKENLNASSLHRLSNKRRSSDESTAFNKEWTKKYLFVETNNVAVCSVCKHEIHLFTVDDIERHYTQKHAMYNKYAGTSQEDKILQLRRILTDRQNFDDDVMTIEGKISKISYSIAHQIAKRSRPYSDGEFLKEMVEIMINISEPEQNIFANIDASPPAISRAVEDISCFLEENLKKTAANFVFFSLAIGENIIANNTAYLPIFIRGVDAGFNVTQEMASLVSMNMPIGPQDLHEAVNSTLKRFSLHLVKLSRVITKGGKNKKLVKLIQSDAIAAGNSELMNYEKNQAFNLFETEIDQIPNVLRTECIGLRSNVQLKEEFRRIPALDFYKKHFSKEMYPLLRDNVLFMMSLFSCDCTKMFSKMKRTIYKNRFLLSDEELEHATRIALNSVNVDLQSFFSTKNITN